MKRNNPSFASGQDHLPLDLLRRYQQGALPGPDEHRVERHLLDCELCSDVLAGMETQSAGQTAAAVQELHRRVAAAGQRSGGKVIPLFSRPNLAAAAALLLLLCSGALVLVYNLQQVGRQQAPLAGVQSGQQEPTGPAVLKPAPGTGGDAGPGAAPVAPAPAVGPVASAAPRARSTVALSKPVNRPKRLDVRVEGFAGKLTEVKTGSFPAATSGAGQVADSAQPMPPAIAAAQTGPASAPAAEGAATKIVIRGFGGAKKGITGAAPMPGSHTVEGRVLDDQGLPLPGVTVTLKGSSLGTITGPDGKYRLQLPQNLSQADLSFAYIGYSTQEKKLALPGTDPVNVTLAPDRLALNEVVVTGYGTKREASGEEEITAAASPRGGWGAFSKYLKANTRQPAGGGGKTSGRVVVGFTVQADGSLAGLRVLKSLSPEADAEALRLVQLYPAWLPARAGQEARAQDLRATVRFRGSR